MIILFPDEKKVKEYYLFTGYSKASAENVYKVYLSIPFHELGHKTMDCLTYFLKYKPK